MKRFFALLSLVLLAACSGAVSPPQQMSLEQSLKNPLVADRYWSEMAEHMADFTRTKSPLSKDPVKSAIIEQWRKDALALAEHTRDTIKEGMAGRFLASEDPVLGTALLLGNQLFFSSEFLTYPTPAMHVYLTTAVDPRGVNFPDSSALNLGLLQTPYGAQEYTFDESAVKPEFRTVVLYDTRLERIYGFAQLSK